MVWTGIVPDQNHTPSVKYLWWYKGVGRVRWRLPLFKSTRQASDVSNKGVLAGVRFRDAHAWPALRIRRGAMTGRCCRCARLMVEGDVGC